MNMHRTARHIIVACEESGRITGDRSVTTEDGYIFHRQPDGSWTDGDMTFGSLDEIESQVGIKHLGPGKSDRGLQASIAAKVIDAIGAGLRSAIEREAMWQSTLHENYDDDFGQWLEYSDMYGLARKLGFTTAEEAWKANPTVQGSIDPQDFRIVPDGERMDLRVDAALGWICESCGSVMSSGEPCDCIRRPEARQPDLARAAGEALLEAGGSAGSSLSLPIMAAQIIASNGYFVGEVFMPDMRTNPRNKGRMGNIVIGGDRGDVWATSTHADERDGVEGVTLTDVEFRTTLDFDGLDHDELLDEVRQVVGESYDSIQEDTFVPTRIAILAPDESGRLVRRSPAKPIPVDYNVDTEDMDPEICPRCKGHGGVFPADEGENCNLCDGIGEVFRHPDGSYSNETDKNTYLY